MQKNFNLQMETRNLVRYDKQFNKIAYDFAKKFYFFDRGRTSHEDLVQTLRMTYVKLLRQGIFDENCVPSKNELRFMSAMRSCMLKNCPIAISEVRFAKRQADLSCCEPISLSDETCNSIPANAADNEKDFLNWVDSLPVKERTIAKSIINGDTIKDMIGRGEVTTYGSYHTAVKHISQRYLRDYRGLAA